MAEIAAALAVLNEAIAAHEPAHVFALFSGGHDSLTATAITAAHPRFTAAVHINTGIGIDETREFVRETCAEQDWPLLEYGPPEMLAGHRMGPQMTYEEMVLAWGFPGPPQHKVMYTRLKERALRVLASDYGPNRILLATGIRWQESTRRMRNYAKSGKFDRHGRWVWANPIADWSKAECNDFIAWKRLRRNPVVDLIHKSGECLCGAFAADGEIVDLEQWFPAVAARLHDLEQRAEAAGQIACVWGRRMDDVNHQQTRLFPILPLCQSCEAVGVSDA